MPTEDTRRWQREIDQWIVSASQSIVQSARVQPTLPSTQDYARSHPTPGLLVTTPHQTAGRGQLGRHWIDNEGLGIALTLITPSRPPEHLALAGAVAVHRTVDHALSSSAALTQIRWPNDILVDSKKIAGILIEVSDHMAFMGIGINVNQQSFPNDLRTEAISLWRAADTDAPLDRLPILLSLLGHLSATLQAEPVDLSVTFTRADALRGTSQTFQCDGQSYTGLVESIDPLTRITLRTHGRRIHLPAATTRRLPASPSDRASQTASSMQPAPHDA